MQSTQMDVKLEAEHGVVCSFANDFLGYFGWPTLAKMDDGTLVAAASGLRNEHVCPFGRNVFCTSTDEGRSWTSMRVANDSPLDDRDTGVVCLGGDKMLLSWFTTDNRAQADRAKPEAAAVWQTAFAHITDDNVARWAGAWVCASDDAGESWKAPVKVPLTAPHGSPPHLLLHSSGALVCAYGYRQEPFGERVMISRDGGESWDYDYILRDDGPDRDLGYPSSVELADGSLLTMYYQKIESSEEKCSLLWSRWRLPE